MLIRPRRTRITSSIRSLVRENHLSPSDLIAPLFLIEGEGKEEEIPSMPLVKRYSADRALVKAYEWYQRGVLAVLLFPVIDPALKDHYGKGALDPAGIIPRALELFKKELPQMTLITDVALDPYTSHGHDGLVDERGIVLNDETVDVLKEVSLLHASMGADIVAPSDMMDGRVLAIRECLDDHGFEETAILAYTAKYASALYGPFREALQVTLRFGDKKNYQMDPANKKEGVKELYLDEKEGADLVMVKPALFYLDMISSFAEKTNLPVVAYHVSGEYSMVMAASEKGWLDSAKVFYEAALCMKRAGARLIVSYAIDSLLSTLEVEGFVEAPSRITNCSYIS